MKTTNRAILLSAVVVVGLLFASIGLAEDIDGKVNVVGIRSPENIAVYVDSIPGKDFDPPAQHAVMQEKQLQFAPHVLVVEKGTTVDFVNDDPVDHPVYWPSFDGNKKEGHDLGSAAEGSRKSYQFNEPGIAPLLCTAHPDMAAYIVVAPTPYYAVTDKAGQFTIKGVPPGHYTLKTWSAQGKPATQPVEIAPADAANVVLTVTK